MIPRGRVRDRSANCKVTIVGRAYPNFNFLKIDHDFLALFGVLRDGFFNNFLALSTFFALFFSHPT